MLRNWPSVGLPSPPKAPEPRAPSGVKDGDRPYRSKTQPLKQFYNNKLKSWFHQLNIYKKTLLSWVKNKNLSSLNWFYPSVESVQGKRSVALMERWKEPRVDWLDLRERDNKTKQKNMSRIFKSSSTCYSHTKQQSYRRTQSPRVIRDIRRNRSHLWPWFADKFEKVFLNWPQNHHHQPKAHSFGPSYNI